MKHYDKVYFAELEKGEEIETPRNLRIIKVIEKYKKDGKLLDIGIGTGLFLYLCYRRGWKELSGLDVSSYAVNFAKKRFKDEIVLKVGELEKAIFKHNSFDVVNMRHSIEHLKDPQETLRVVHQILSPGGILAIATPDSFGIHAKVFGKDWPHWSPPYHLHFFSKQSLKEIVESCGFKVVEIKTEELTSYDPFKLMFFKLGIKGNYNTPTLLSKWLNNLLAYLGKGEGLLLIAQKPK